MSVRPSVRMEQLGRRSKDFHEILYLSFKKTVEKIQVPLKSPRITGTLHEDQRIFLISRWIILRMRNVSDKSCTENQNTHYMSITFFPPQKLCRL
jgi:hypothetical protein